MAQIYIELRGMSHRQCENHICSIDGYTQLGKTFVMQLGITMFSVMFSSISVLSIQNNDGSATIERHTKDLTGQDSSFLQKMRFHILDFFKSIENDPEFSEVNRYHRDMLLSLFVENTQIYNKEKLIRDLDDSTNTLPSYGKSFSEKRLIK